MLQETQEALVRLRNSSASCMQKEAEHVATLAAASQERAVLQQRLNERMELNAWLNQTAAARESALRAEQTKALMLQGSVQSLKEQVNLMQGQLVTAQQQQGTLHSGRRKASGRPH